MSSTVTAPPELTVAQKVLLAAHRLEQTGHSPFSAEALIVACWQESPRSFGLKGFAEQYPDSNRVLSILMGERGLARQGWLAKVGVKLYTLTERGRKLVDRLEAGEVPPEEPRKKITRDMEKFLLRVTSSVAFTRFRTKAKESITFRDACNFWGISEPSDTEALRVAAEEMPDTITDIEQQFKSEWVELSNGRRVSLQEMKSLHELHSYLTELFARHLNPARARR